MEEGPLNEGFAEKPAPEAGAACSFPGCMGTAVGTCAGYKVACRSPLCAIHARLTPSSGRSRDPLFSYLGPSPTAVAGNGLCPQCTERKRMDDTAEAIYAEYQQAAESVMHMQDDWIKSVALIGVVLDCLVLYPLLYLGHKAAYIIGSLVAGAIGSGLLALYWVNKKQILAQAAERRSGFAEFYRAWRRDRALHGKDLAEAGEIGGIVRRVAAAVAAPDLLGARGEPDEPPAGRPEEQLPRPDGRPEPRERCPRCRAPTDTGREWCPACGQALCPNCGAAVAENDTLCSSCGIGFCLVCPHCGRELDSDAKACHECGLDVSGRCTGCGKPVDGSQARCPACGQVLCPECGSAVGENDTACQTCGAGLAQERQVHPGPFAPG